MDLGKTHNAASSLLCCCFFLLFAFLPSPFVVATDHIVGANHGWQVPADAGASANLNYTNWAASHTFVVGDFLTFRYQTNIHSVFQVNYSTYVNCTFSMYYGNDWIYNWTNKGGRTVVPLNESKIYYFSCGIGNHCQQGMKVAVNVAKNSPDVTESTKSSKSKHSGAAYSTVFWVLPALAQTFIFLFLSLFYPEL